MDDLKRLLELATQEDSSFDYRQHGEIGKFIHELGISVSNEKIESEEVYLLYFKWCKDIKKKKPKTRYKFHREFNKVFKPYNGWKQRYYYICSSKLTLTQVEKGILRELFREAEERRRYVKEKKDKKKRCKKSLFKKTV